MKQYIPNSLTALRLILAVVFPFAPEAWRLPIFAISAFTEFADGFLSRRWEVTSDLGRTLDPIADKAFVFAVIATLFFEGAVQLWEFAVVGVRDLVVFAGAAWVYLFGDRADFDQAKPRVLGKFTTNFQFAFLLTALIWQDVPAWLTIPTAIISAAAAIDYARFYLVEVRGG